MSQFTDAVQAVNTFIQEANKAILLAIQNPTTMPTVLKAIAAITKAVASKGSDIDADMEALQDIAIINQNLIDAVNAAHAQQA